VSLRYLEKRNVCQCEHNHSKVTCTSHGVVGPNPQDQAEVNDLIHRNAFIAQRVYQKPAKDVDESKQRLTETRSDQEVARPS